MVRRTSVSEGLMLVTPKQLLECLAGRCGPMTGSFCPLVASSCIYADMRLKAGSQGSVSAL